MSSDREIAACGKSLIDFHCFWGIDFFSRNLFVENAFITSEWKALYNE